MKRLAVALVSIAVFCPPVVATPFLDLRVGPNSGPDEVDALVAPGSGEQFFDLTFIQSEEDPDDAMNAYDVMVRAPRPGVTLLRAARPDDWIFTDPGAVFTVAEADAGHLLIRASSPDESVDITQPPRNAARIYYRIDAGAPAGLYPITLEEGTTRIYSTESGGVHPPLGVTDPGLVLVTPEPAGLAVLALSATLLLRRRRG
jgi:hypothetical protein